MLEFLKSILGENYTEELDQKISEEVGKAFVSKNDFNSAKAELKSVKEQLAQMKVDYAVEKALTGANARNLTAAKALLAPFLKDAKLGDDGNVSGLDEAVKQLCEGEDTAFLFGSQKQEGIQVAGAKPASGMAETSGTKESDYQARWTEAMKAGNTISAIQIKREALAEGITLN